MGDIFVLDDVYSKGLDRRSAKPPAEPLSELMQGFGFLAKNKVLLIPKGLSGRPLEPFGTQLLDSLQDENSLSLFPEKFNSFRREPEGVQRAIGKPSGKAFVKSHLHPKGCT